MSTPRNRLVAVVGVALAVNVAVQILRAFRDFTVTDFQTFDAAGRIVRVGGCLYCATTQLSAAHAVAGGYTDLGGLFIGPPLVAWLFAPFAGMDAHAAMAIFVVISLLALAAAGWLITTRWMPDLKFAQRVSVVVACLMSVPAAYGIAIGQIDPIIFAATVAGITLSRRLPLVGGVLIGSLALKPQLFVLIPVALLAARQWRVLAGAGIGAGVVGLSLFDQGIGHVLDWPRFLTTYGSAHGGAMASLPTLVGNLTGSAALAILATVALFAVGAVAIYGCRRDLVSVEAAMALGLALTLVASPHLLPYDLVFLTIPLARMAEREWTQALVFALLLSVAAVVDALAAVAFAEPLLLCLLAVAVVRPTLSRPRRRVALT